MANRWWIPPVVVGLALTGCGEDEKNVGLFGDEDGGSGITGASDSGGTTGETDAGSSTDSGTTGGTTSGDSAGDDADAGTTDDGGDTTDGGGIRLDVPQGGDDGIGPCDPNTDPTCSGCTGVDLLFVIDNSGSMGDYQDALGIAFPAFASTLATSLPPGTNVHVGVTSSEMGYASGGSSSSSNGTCTFTDSNTGNTNEALYITPDVTNTGTNGAQGRLYRPNGGSGPAYFEADLSDPSQVAGLESWFSAAAAIGTGGSNIEMITAPAGWAADPANDATNAGFIRDEGTVLVVFFMQDEADQSPVTTDGTGPDGAGGTEDMAQAMMNKLAARKPLCGGTNCIITGGFLNANNCNNPDRPVEGFVQLAGAAPVIAPLPESGPFGNNTPQDIADEMNQTLSTTLAAVIAQKCEEIPPAG